MRVTNSSMDECLADGERIKRRYAGALDDFAGSQLANPLATNLSIVTADRMISSPSAVHQRRNRRRWLGRPSGRPRSRHMGADQIRQPCDLAPLAKPILQIRPETQPQLSAPLLQTGRRNQFF